ncbi:MAG: TAT-variant-translocated molybdopterin oxidoreductase [Pseudolabrys sp.]|nr:TAT-variant-translocated molybdopterin oxidoreductase [Pseudolabrys sp.]
MSSAFDLQRIRERLVAGRQWSCVEELLGDAEFTRWVEAEFPATARLAAPARRQFLQLMGASLLMAGLAGCGEGRSDVALPYVNQPENAPPGVPRHYATAVTFEGYAQPVLATVNDGRPTKLDGNPGHPATRGGSDIFMQTAVLQLYDPARAKAPSHGGEATTWAEVSRFLTGARAQWAQRRGEGLRILCGNITSPTVTRQLRALLTALPQAKLHVFEPVGNGHRAEAMRLAFGEDAEPVYALDRADVIVSLDDDLLGPGPWQVAHARAWANRRGEGVEPAQRARLYSAESVPGLTGVVASRRIPVDASSMPDLMSALAGAVGVATTSSVNLSDAQKLWVERAAKDLLAHRGAGLVTCGAHLPPETQALAALVNEKLGNVGATLSYRAPSAMSGDSIVALADDIRAGKVETLIVLDANPVYAAPASLRFGELMRKVPTTIGAGLYPDETAAVCQWHIPRSHDLESWGDALAVDGTAMVMQPVIAPLYSTRTLPQVLAMLSGPNEVAADAPVRETWAASFGADFDARWQRALYEGFVNAPPAAPLQVTAKLVEAPPPANVEGDVDIVFRPDPSVWDGRLANVAWLQEMPKPLTKITWDNPIAVSPRLADNLKVVNGDKVRVETAVGAIEGPAWIMPGQAANTVALFLGYGRHLPDQLADGIGASAYALRDAKEPWHARGTITRIDGKQPFATSQLHHRMEGFDFVKEVSAAEPTLPPPKAQPSLYPEKPSPHIAWGMAIDLDRCIGCNACIAACNVENNVLVVGREEVARGREMLWLRVDRYYTGDIEEPRSYFQPVPCMHCEDAPCEMGCPVNATVHSPEGLNQQIYNRCIGTRTCSSYCPYKVRRFNWFDYRDKSDQASAAHNPDVTVRSRGVMEKCTYCVQRIQRAHVEADKEGRPLKGSDVTTACQQACPTTAITFGNIKDDGEEVSKWRKSGRHYVLLEEQGTRPRTTYLARWNDGDGEDV